MSQQWPFSMLSNLATIICPFKTDLSSHLYHMHIVTMRYFYINFQSKTFKYVTHIFPISVIHFQICSMQELRSYKYENPSHNCLDFCNNKHQPSLWSYSASISNTIFLQISTFTQSKKLLTFHVDYIFIVHLQWLTNNFKKCILTNASLCSLII